MDILKIPKEDWDDTGFENLAIAVVQQACEDYKKAYMGEFVDHKSPEWTMKEIENWVRSQDYEYLTKVNGPALLKKVRIAALEEMIEVYEDALSSGGDTKLRIFIQKPKKVTNVSFQIPPDYLQDFFEVMRKQLNILKNEKKREEESNEKEKARA